MKNILDYLNKADANPVFMFEGKEYKIKKDYKITLFLQEEQKKIDKAKRSDEDFDDVNAQFKLIMKFFEMAVSKDLVKALDSVDMSEVELMFVFQYIVNKRAGMTDEEAAAKAMENDSKNE